MRRRLISFAAAAAVAVLPCSTAALADLTPSPSPVTPPLPLLVTLGSIRPLAPQPGDTLTVRGQLSNLGDQVDSGLTLSLLVSRTKVGSRGEFDQFADATTGDAPPDATAPSSEHVTLPRTTLDPGANERFTITVPVDDLALPELWQVYEMTIVADADTALGHVSVGRLHTFLPWAPLGQSGTGDPTRVAWVWPLIDRPHRSDGGAWLDDDLAASLAPDGRLGRLLAAGNTAEHQQPPPPPPRHKKTGRKNRATPPAKPKASVQSVPVTWVLDPALIDDVSTMRRGYTVHTSSGVHAGTGKDVASRWLSQLQQDVSTTEYFGVPYADPDVTAATHAGFAPDVQYASTQGAKLLGHEMGPSPLPYAWPPDGYADQKTLDTFFAAGETTVVLDSAALPPLEAPSETPSAHARVATPATAETFDALLSDDTLNRVVNDGAQNAADGPLDVQRVLSELLMIQAERPFDQRSLVITPDRNWDPSASYATALLADTGKVPWVTPIPLSAVAHTPVYTAVKRGPLDYPASERVLQLGRDYLAGIDRIKHLVDTFTAVVPPATVQTTTDPTVRSFKDGVLRLLSSAWRTDPALAGAASRDLEGVVQRTMNQVHIASRSSSLVTLTSHSGIVPVTVANDLDIPVQVVVKVEPDQHLVVKDGRVVQLIGPHRQLPVDIHATAQTSGVFGLTVQLTTTSGRPYGPPVPLRIRSTAYGTTALLITGGATAVLLLTVIVRLIRRARAARRSAAAPA